MSSTTSRAEKTTRVPYEQVKFSINPSDIAPNTDSQPHFSVIGQDRALMALRMTLSIQKKGYNAFVSGPSGTGKRTAVYQVIKELPFDPESLRDIAIGYNFTLDSEPRILYFKKGTAKLFREKLRQFVTGLGESLHTLVRQDQFKTMRDKMLIDSEQSEKQLIFDFEGKLTAKGFQIVQIDEENEKKTDILPLVKGEVSDFDELQELVTKGEMQQSAYDSIREQYFNLVDEMQELFRNLQNKRQQTKDKIRDMRIQIISPYIQEQINILKDGFAGPEIHAFLTDLCADLLDPNGIVSRLNLSSQTLEKSEEQVEQEEQTELLLHMIHRYDVNVLIDHSNTSTAPIVFEQYPDLVKLFGTIESVPDNQEHISPHMLIRAGSILKASGGFLILRAEDLLREDDAYIYLKKALNDEKLEIKSQQGPGGSQGPQIKPQPIAINVKVIIMAPDGLYELLFERDEDFQKLFKIPADFDDMIDSTPEIRRSFVNFFDLITSDGKLPPLDDSGYSALLEFAARDSEFRSKLSTRFSLLSDLIHESAYWAKLEGKTKITRADISKTLSTRHFLYSLPEEKFDEMVIGGEIIIDLKEKAIGRVNGLAVMDRGFYSYGRPTVISAQVSPGSEGVINVEHEAGLSGEIHDKGAFIVGAFIQATYARDFPLSIKATICFEQSYNEVDGDSASSTEVYALLSAIAQVPIRQDLAVTGSVNQRGQIQPVGGVNEKIEGFYTLCKKTGFTNTQGVIIPHQNLQNLILNPEVEESVKRGEFHLYAVKDVYEGMEILSGMECSARNEKGNFSPTSLNSIIEKHLKDMAFLIKDFGA